LDSRCSNCYFGDKCCHPGYCDDYAPLDSDDPTDKYMDELIEREKQRFVNEWRVYVNQYSDGND